MRFLSDLCRRHEGIYRVHWAALRRSAMLNESSVISLFHQRQETEGIRIYNSLAPLSCWSHKEGNACQPNPPRLLWLVLHHSICKCQLCPCSAHAKRTKRRGKWASIFFSWWSGLWTRKSGVSAGRKCTYMHTLMRYPPTSTCTCMNEFYKMPTHMYVSRSKRIRQYT